MYEAAIGGDEARARELDAELQPIYEATTVTSNPIPVKAALEMLGIIDGHLRLPMVPASQRGAGRGQDRARAARPAGRRRHGVVRPRAASAGEDDAAMTAPLRVLPLGGLGEIGKNMTVVEHDGRIVVVDTGLMFPTTEMLGIDLVLPDFSYLRDRADDIEAIVLTHGHEDHVGALPVRPARDRDARRRSTAAP